MERPDVYSLLRGLGAFETPRLGHLDLNVIKAHILATIAEHHITNGTAYPADYAFINLYNQGLIPIRDIESLIRSHNIDAIAINWLIHQGTREREKVIATTEQQTEHPELPLTVATIFTIDLLAKPNETFNPNIYSLEGGRISPQ